MEQDGLESPADRLNDNDVRVVFVADFPHAMKQDPNFYPLVSAAAGFASRMTLARVGGCSPESRYICHVIRNAGALRITHKEVVSPIVGVTRNVFVPAIIPNLGLNFRRGPDPSRGLGANLEWDGLR